MAFGQDAKEEKKASPTMPYFPVWTWEEKDEALVALSEDCRRSSLQSLHLIFCELWLRDQGLRLTEAQWYSLSHNLKRMVVLYEKMSQIYCFKAHAAPAISLHSITFAALVYTALTH